MVNSPRYINLYNSFLSKSGHVLLWWDFNVLIISSACELETKASIYLAQASLSDLPSFLLEDLPTPELVSKAGKGDVYDTSIWLGQAPTYTPLHRDPNPNLFVQLAGKKQVRLFKPDLGNAIFHHVQASIGGAANATMRGAEMMEGAERAALEQAVWHPSSGAFWASEGLQCELGSGDGLFIPKGWWHSIKGVGQGMIGSVNWWFR
ncbi:Clavaminate synthase-like protein, partial [Aureobasidium melanogenum]|uniref:Clavaminate synthase-like protein n=1 Tax=Aureobasidium melanogenum (strain CBS 110374) TaxID=1043003 RepID=A0A074VG33_AURM1